MERGMNKVIIVTRKTRLKELIQKYNTIDQARFHIEHMGADFSDYIVENTNYENSVNTARLIAERYARTAVIDKDFLPNMIFGRDDIIISVGQDGLVCNTMKYLDGQFLLGVNPDVKRWDGILLPFEPGDLERALPSVIERNCITSDVTFAVAKTNDGQQMLAVNDLFIGPKTHISARYDITWNERTEYQSSSGVIVSTGIGQTGWYRSIVAQAEAGLKLFGCSSNRRYEPIKWGEKKLSFAVREPYPSNVTRTEIVLGTINKGDKFVLESKMAEKGVIFSDGMEADAIDFNAGTRVSIGIADKRGCLVRAR